jgi:hypothetical protein
MDATGAGFHVAVDLDSGLLHAEHGVGSGSHLLEIWPS